MTELQKRIALVTGATRGIGRAIAVQLAKTGFYVIGTATTIEGAQEINAQFESLQLPGEGIVLDVTSQAQIDDLLMSLTERSMLPSVLVNNAGITADNLLLRMEDEEWNRVIETNLSGVFRLTRACLKPMFRARYGRIVNITSIVAFNGNAGQVNYTAAKAGLVGLTKSLAQEMASRNITVNLVAPGFIETDMTAHLPDLVKDEMFKRIPMKRLGQPEDVAAAVDFLVSEQARYITGETIHVNGGMYMG